MKKKRDFALTSSASLSKELLALCRGVTAKRARVVIDHILKKGFVTNEELNELYGYDHPPRAIRDVREHGIPLITHKIVSSKTGRKVGAYTFDLLANIQRGRVGGRRAFPKKFKADLIATYGAKDAFTQEVLASNYLQIDHRVPYEVGGDASTLDVQDYMLIDAASQRNKSWACEHCENWLKLKKPSLCGDCFWASPEKYSHIALKQKRRVDIVWSGNEVDAYNRILSKSKIKGMDIGDYIKLRASEE